MQIYHPPEDDTAPTTDHDRDRQLVMASVAALLTAAGLTGDRWQHEYATWEARLSRGDRASWCAGLIREALADSEAAGW